MFTRNTGYCGICYSVVDTNPLGYLARHGSGPCDGSNHTPWPLPATPEAAFSAEPRRAKCAYCDNPDTVGVQPDGAIYMRGHRAPGVTDEQAPLCPGSWKPFTYKA